MVVRLHPPDQFTGYPDQLEGCLYMNGWNSLEHYWFTLKCKWYYQRLSDHIDDLAEDIEEELEILKELEEDRKREYYHGHQQQCDEKDEKRS